MHVQQQHKTVANNKSQSQNQLLTILFVVIGSFSFGLIPILAHLTPTNTQQQIIIPTEAELWQEVSRAE